MVYEVEVKSVYFVVNVDWFFLSHRLPLAVEAKRQGFEVTIIANDTGKANIIKKHGFNFIDFPLERGTSSWLKEIKTFVFLLKLFLFNKPTLFHLVGLKIILMGTIAHSISFSKSKLLNALSGAGTMFTGSKKQKNIAFSLLLKLYSCFCRSKSYYIFQNTDDLKLFQSLSTKVINYKIIKGSGVNLEMFHFTKLELDSNDKLIILFIGRILKEKGIIEFIEAARLLEPFYKNKIKFIILGGIDLDNPSSITKDEMSSYQIEDYIEWHGYTDNIYQYLVESYMVVLPSYREGLPKTLIEACAIGRPIITTNAIGCKDVVDDGINGFLVPIKNSKLLSDKIKLLLENQELAKLMGIEGRKKAETEFDEKIINEKIIELYNLT